jgi:hypothetical protein
MASGYTTIVCDRDDVTLREFAMRCARAHVALIGMSDAPLDAQIPDTLPCNRSDYHNRELSAARARLIEFSGMSLEQAAVLADAQHDCWIRSWQQCEYDARIKLSRYKSMLAKVESWTPPTPKHADLKRFMVVQLQNSIDHEYYCSLSTRPVRESTETWLSNAIASAQSDIAYHSRRIDEEEREIRERQEWIDALRASLEGL